MSLVEKDLKYIWHPCSQMKDYETLPPIVVDHAKGVYLYGADGKDYIDIVSSWWCNLLGHCNPVIGASIKDQLDRLEHVIFANFTHAGAIALCEQLSAILPGGLAKFVFSDNGSSAVECALKMAFQYQRQVGSQQRSRFMCLEGGYHGETIGALAVGALDQYSRIYRPMLMDSIRIDAPDCYRCPYGMNRDECRCECFEHAEQCFEEYGRQTCAIIVEPLLQGAAGMRIYPARYLEKLRELCDRYGVLLIADEIATGFGRTGRLFACDHAQISPDIICLSKGLTGGYLPMAITVATDAIYAAFYADYREGKAFMHSHTYSGNPLGCAAALAVLRILREEPIMANARVRERYLSQRLMEALAEHPHVGEIRHIGLIHAVELVAERETKRPFDAQARTGYRIFRQALAHGLLLRPLGDVLYFNPALIITEAEIDLAVERCVRSIRDVLN